jgi:hypothetical protein
VKEPADDHDMDMPLKEAPPATCQEVLAAMQLLSHISINCRNEQEFLQFFKSLSLISDTSAKKPMKKCPPLTSLTSSVQSLINRILLQTWKQMVVQFL